MKSIKKIIICCIVLTFMMCMCLCCVGCTKNVGLITGTYIASDIKMHEDLTIDYLQIDIVDQETADDEIIDIKLSYNGGEVVQTVCGLTYYSKELKIAFEFDDKTGYIIARTLQNGDRIFIKGNLTIENTHVSIELNKSI